MADLQDQNRNLRLQNSTIMGLSIFGVACIFLSSLDSMEKKQINPLKEQLESLKNKLEKVTILIFKKQINPLKDQLEKVTLLQLKKLINPLKEQLEAIKNILKKDAIKIVPFITQATWRGFKNYNSGGFVWNYNLKPYHNGDSNFYTNSTYVKPFCKMDSYLTELNKSEETRKLVEANLQTLGESCKGNDKRLTLQYECRKYNMSTRLFGESVYFKNSKQKTKEVIINQNFFAYIDCFDTMEVIK